MDSLIRFSLKQKVFFNLLFVVLIVAGSYSLFNLPTDRYPNVNFGEVIINTYFPGASPTDVETLVTHEIEESLESVKDIQWIKSTSQRENSRIHLKFVDDADYAALYNEVRFEVLNILDRLPDEIDPPRMSNLDTQDFLPVIVINLAGDHENRALTLMAEELKSALQQIPKVKEIKLVGEHEREFHVYLDPRKIIALGVSFDDVASALNNANVSIPAGDFKDNSGEFVIKVDEKFRTRDQVVSTIIRMDADGSFVRVEDVISRAELNYRDPRVIGSVNGKNALALQIIKTPQGNALDIKAEALDILEKFKPIATKQAVDIVLTQDSTVYIKDGLNTLSLNMLVGICLVSLIIWYFMGARNAGIITIGIPFSFMISILLMYLSGNSLNELTLFSFVLVTGIIVDDAIVVTENIYRHIERGEQLNDAIIYGTAEVSLPVISATLTTVAAFMPMLIMTGVTGEFFALIPTTVSYAILASLFECLLILPIHYMDFGPRPSADLSADRLNTDNPLLKTLRVVTNRLLAVTLRYRIRSVLIVFLLFVATITILGVSVSGKIPLIRIKFFPDDYTLYYVDVSGKSGASIQQVDQRVHEITEFILQDGPGKSRSVAGFAGFYFNDDYEQIHGSNYGTVMVTLPAKEDQTFNSPLDHLEDMRKRLKSSFETDGFKLHIHPQKDGPPRGKDLNLRVLGSNPTSILNLADDLYTFINQHPDIGPYLDELGDNRGKPKRVFQFIVRHDRAQEYGLTTKQVARLAGSVLDGRYVGHYRLVDEEIDLKLFIDTQFFDTPEDALYIPLLEHASGPIRLKDLTRIETFEEPGDLNRYQHKRAISIQANLKASAPTSIPVVVATIESYYETIREKYPGASINFGGEHEDTQRSYTSLAYAFVIATLLIYMILATQFQSYLQPFIILSAIVFALIGVVSGKLVTQSLFTLNSFIAVIGVAGVVVNDALVLIDFINKGYRRGLSRREAIFEGVNTRLRPILLTTLTTSLGLLPMAIGVPSYSLVWGSMASTFVTGLATATILTLFIVPVFWDLLQGWLEKHQFKSGQTGTHLSDSFDSQP